jgi:predicted O-methyltransferase YrrM
MEYKYGGMSLEEDECDFLQDFIRSEKIKTVIEFGAGLSTRIIADVIGKKNVWSYEIYQATIDMLNGYNILERDFRDPYKNEHLDSDLRAIGRSKFDLAFVDSPEGHYTYEGKYSRFYSMVTAKKLSDIIVFHDVYRQGEKNTIDLLLSDYDREDFLSRRGLSVFRKRGEK